MSGTSLGTKEASRDRKKFLNREPENTRTSEDSFLQQTRMYVRYKGQLSILDSCSTFCEKRNERMKKNEMIERNKQDKHHLQGEDCLHF